jgi:Cyclin, N-terminal domain
MLTNTITFFPLNSDRQVVGIAMNLLDRFLLRCEDGDDTTTTNAPHHHPEGTTASAGNTNNNNSRNYQLSAMTCLYLTLKLHTRHYKRHLTILTELSRGQFVTHDILAMENIVLATLDWRVHPVTPMTFVQYYIQYYQYQYHYPPPPQHDFIEDLDETRTDREEEPSAPPVLVPVVAVWQVVHEIARYCTELAVLDCQHSAASTTSQLAYACILAAMDLLTEEAMSLSERAAFVKLMIPTFVPAPPSARLQQSLARLISPELLVAEHHGSHPIAMAWGLAWFRHSSNSSRDHHPAAATASSSSKSPSPAGAATGSSAASPPTTPVRQQQQPQRSNSTNHINCYTTESPVSVL